MFFNHLFYKPADRFFQVLQQKTNKKFQQKNSKFFIVYYVHFKCLNCLILPHLSYLQALVELCFKTNNTLQALD